MKTIRFAFAYAGLLCFAQGLAQDPPPAAPARDAENSVDGGSGAASQQGGWRKFGEGRRDRDGAPAPAAKEPVPAELVVPAGTWIKVRVDEPLSSDRNLAGDAFAATLTQPIVVNGYVVARRGQTIEGRVSEAVKAGKAKGTSRLGVELVRLSIVDGQQLPVRTQLLQYSGGTSVGRDATAVATTAGAGAAIGAAAAGGFGAGMGAIAGAGASAIGVLLTRGRATVIDPEAELTFRTLDPLTIATERSGQAFQPVRQEDYEPRTLQRRVERRTRPDWGPYWGGGLWYPYSYWGPGFWGPSFYYFSGPRIVRGGGHFRRR